MGKRKKYWIQRAIKRPTTLTKWIVRNRAKLARITKMRPITRDGEINTRMLLRLRKTQWYKKLSTRTKRRINLAITLERLSKG